MAENLKMIELTEFWKTLENIYILDFMDILEEIRNSRCTKEKKDLKQEE